MSGPSTRVEPGTRLACATLLVGAAALGLVTVSAPAHAADITSTPPRLRGDVDFLYRGGVSLMAIEDRPAIDQAYSNVGRYVGQRHGLDIAGWFAPWHGLAVGLELPLVFHRTNGWSEANDMRYDPEYGHGTMVGGRSLPAEVVDGSAAARTYAGLGDIGLALRFVPFAQRDVPGREAAASMSLDVGVRFPSGSNHDAVRTDGTAGPGRGGPTLELGLAGSRRMKSVEPYLAVRAALTAPYREVTVDADGDPLAAPDGDPAGTEFNPADTVGVRFGTEVVAAEDRAADSAMRLDIGFGLTYVGPHELSSGTRIPAPLRETVGRPAVEAEHVTVDVALGFRIRPRSEFEVRIDIGGAWSTPHTLELVDRKSYTVQTAPGSFAFQWGAGVRIRPR